MEQVPTPHSGSQRFGSSSLTAIVELLMNYIKGTLPEGRSLPDDIWQSRHWGIRTLLWLHAVGIVCFGIIMGANLEHSLAEGAVLAVMAVTASWPNTPRKFRASMASLGLITASAEIVHLSGGYIEMHFHFFVMLAVIVLYQDWLPFLLALGYVIIHHGVIGVLDPGSVYNHPDAFAHPWKWATIHGVFVLAASIAGIVSWRLNEVLRARNELILNSTGEGIIGLNLQNKVIFMNPAAAKMIGYGVDELKDQPLQSILQPGKMDGAPISENEDQIQTLIQEGTDQPIVEGEFWRKDGASFLAEYISTPIREGGVVVGAVVAFKDITERKQAQAALQKAKDELEIRVAERTAELNEMNERLRFELTERRRAEERTRLIINTALDAVITMDAAGLITDWNTQAEAIFGWSYQEIIGRCLSDTIIPDQYREAHQRGLKHFLAMGEGPMLNKRVETMALHRDGREFPIELSISPLRLGENIIFSAFVRDITRRKQDEAALRQSEQRFRQVVSSISDHIYVTEVTENGHHINLYLSPHIEPLTGYPFDKFLADWSFWPSIVIHPDDRAAAAAQAARLARGQNSEMEYRLIRANGDIIWVRDSGRVEKDAARRSLIVYGLVTDITERKQAEAALALARDQALEANRLKTELLAKVSHELRTPLGAILGFAELLEVNTYGPLSEKQRQVTTKIINSTHYLTTLVNELLDQAQLEAGRLKLNVHSFAPANLVDDTLTKLSVLARTKGLSLTSDIATDVPATLFGDAARLQQILVNLVSNAIKFTQRGGVRVKLYCPDADYWALRVSDTGPGIPAEAQTYIFEPFRQVDGSITRAHAGTGLGLSIVKQLTTLMGGEITLESKVGQGSTFTVYLPLQPIQEKIS